MISNLLYSQNLNISSFKKEEVKDGKLERALYYRSMIYPIMAEYLDPQKQGTEPKELQKKLDECTLDETKPSKKHLYLNKHKKSLVLLEFIDKIFNNSSKYGINFKTPPSVSDKEWTKTLLIHDLLYYGPVTLLCLSRILKETEELSNNPIYKILLELSNEEEITEIRVNNAKQIFFEAGNKILQWNIPFLSDKQLGSIIERTISESNLLTNSSILLNSSSPIVDFEHPCGYIRSAAMIPPASESPFLTLRIHPQSPYSLKDLVNFGMLSKEMADFLIAAQEAGTTIVIAGTMGSGKTTLLSALSEHWPNNGRKATIEDTPELKPKIHDLIKMRTIDYERDDVPNIDVARLTKACKRHSVRYVVLSEARDYSAWEILQLSQSILGCLMTFHYTIRDEKNLVDQALNTLVALCKQHPLSPHGNEIKHQIASMVQILILIEQDPSDSVRRIVKIYCISGYDEMNGGHFKYTELFKFNNEIVSSTFQKVNSCPNFIKYLQSKGVNYKFK